MNYTLLLLSKKYGKGTVIPVQAVEALRVVRGWGSHIFRHSAHRWQQGCHPYMPAAFYHQEDSWHSFLLQTESTPGPQCGWKDWVNWKNTSHPGLEPATFQLVAAQCLNPLPCAPVKNMVGEELNTIFFTNTYFSHSKKCDNTYVHYENTICGPSITFSTKIMCW
jgi:hypothetical protein